MILLKCFMNTIDFVIVCAKEKITPVAGRPWFNVHMWK